MIFIPIELSKRASASTFFFAKYLASKGYTVVIGNQQIIRWLALFGSTPRSVFFDKSCAYNKRRMSLYKKLIDRDVLLYSSEAEGCIVNDLKSFISFRYSPECSTLCHRIFMWGPRDTNELLKQYSFLESKIVRSGHFRIIFDKFISEKHRKSKAAQSLSVGKHLKILYCSNGSAGIGNDVMNDINTAIINRQSGEYDISNSIKNRSYGLYDMACHIDLLCQLEPMVSHITFRPHPTESVANYNRIFSDRANIIVDNTTPLHEQFTSHDVLLHSGCTTSIQALLYSVPTIVLPSKKSTSKIADQFSTLKFNKDIFSTFNSLSTLTEPMKKLDDLFFFDTDLYLSTLAHDSSPLLISKFVLFRLLMFSMIFPIYYILKSFILRNKSTKYSTIDTKSLRKDYSPSFSFFGQVFIFRPS